MIYVDTGAFIARYLKRDQYHSQAVAGWEQLRKMQARCFTSNFVLDETFTLLGRQASYRFAAERARILYSSESLAVLRPQMEDELEAIELFDKFADQKFSFTDCISFVLMRKARLKKAFSFDSDFERAGFEIWP